jgi:hypothetical protein
MSYDSMIVQGAMVDSSISSRHEQGSGGGKPGKTANAYPTRSTIFASTCRRLNIKRKPEEALQTNASEYGLLSMSRIAHIPLLLYNALLVVVLTLHIRTFVNLLVPSMAFCYTSKVVAYSGNDIFSALEPSKEYVPSMQERCQRYNWNFAAAGWSSSAMAGLLAMAHAAAILCSLAELCIAWTARIKQQWNSRVAKTQAAKDTWSSLPRDVDIHSRDASRLTMISEEEHKTGTVKRGEDESRNSGGSVSSGRVEEVLLECLLP